MKKTMILLLCICALGAYAQPDRDEPKRSEKVEALKRAYITSELALTPVEAEKFWPIYNSFEDKQFELKHQKSISNIKKMNYDLLSKMSDKEALVVLTQMEASEDELFQLRKKLIINLKSVISPVKIIKLKKAEDEFNKKLLQQYRNKGPRR